MKKDMSYAGVMGRKNQILKDSVGIDFTQFERGTVAFDYATLMKSVEYSMEDLIRIQRGTNVGQTPILEMKNLTALARKFAPEGKGARIFVKDEACNPAGSFKDRRAAISVHQAKQMGYKGVITATSGNYGAAVASQAAKHGLQCIVIQEAYDSNHVGQPEILEKARKCEAFGADVIQLSVGPELFYVTLRLLEETGYFNASLYTPYAIAGVETLGYEISRQMRELVGRDPDAVCVTNAGGGNLTGTARGLPTPGPGIPGSSRPAWTSRACIWLRIRTSTGSPSPPDTPASACPSYLGPTVRMCRAPPAAPYVTWTAMSQ